MRQCLALDLRDDPGLIARYEAHHRAVWPEVLAHLRAHGVRELEIFRLGTRLVMLMETDDAGLGLIDYIRTTLKREALRIILRTGQPGQAPERKVIVDYDINDYKAKNELTADRLFTSLTAALRSYQQVQRMVETILGARPLAARVADRHEQAAGNKLSWPRSLNCAFIGVLRKPAAPWPRRVGTTPVRLRNSGGQRGSPPVAR